MSNGAPCGACKFLRRKCVNNCIFAPHFNSEQGAARFAAVHKIFGASNVTKLLHHIPVAKRSDAVLTISYEAQARLSDPVYGCVATIVALQHQVASLQGELMNVQMQLSKCVASLQQQQQQQQQNPSAVYEQVVFPVPMSATSALGGEIQSSTGTYIPHHYRGTCKEDFCGTSSPPPLVSVSTGGSQGNNSNNNHAPIVLKGSSTRSLDVDDEEENHQQQQQQQQHLQQFWPGTTPTAIA
ncbi:LOB domain-containing protein 20 [Selaginella moellendorffii]|uniref:LOB domain-containing protein 20 n=1 Tax=Selaginella moellendorffii TaxID=88036 RepID=UPI000D1CB0E5|nr:LOB domain-containing protein 20 [Selaginella moellendorffii]|eukprot:XP_002983602.2 LOB domain-containing protein 20 [Selaginella moellendorffii]